MTAHSGHSTASKASEFFAMSRELWESAVKGLDSEDKGHRRAVLHWLFAAAPPSWDVDLDATPDGSAGIEAGTGVRAAGDGT